MLMGVDTGVTFSDITLENKQLLLIFLSALILVTALILLTVIELSKPYNDC